MLLKLSYHLASVFGVGYLPKAPGTFGSLAGLLVWYFFPFWGWVPALFILGWAASWHILPYGNNKDPSFIVIDEVVGMMLTLAIIGGHQRSHLIIAFALFRFFDIVKPFPIGWLDHYFEGKGRLLASFGIMLDDVLAGIAAGVLGFFLLSYITLQ